MQTLEDKDPKGWGVKLLSGTFSYDKKGYYPKEYPEWVGRFISRTPGTYGIVIWNEALKKAEVFSSAESLMLLDRLTRSVEWKDLGIALTKKVYRFEIPIERKSNKGGNPAEIEVENIEKKHLPEPIDIEVLRLPPEAGIELISFLEDNKKVLTENAKKEGKMRDEAFRSVHECFFDLMRKDEEQKVGFSTRKFAWVPVKNKPHKWICDQGSDRAVVYLDSSSIFWETSIQHQEQYWKSRNDFIRLEEAVNWVEDELSILEQMPAAEETPDAKENREEVKVRIREKMDQSPYRIWPSELEPETVNYRIVIEVETNPIEFKSIENEFGETFRYDEKYLSPVKLAALLHLDPDHFEMLQPLGEKSSWCRFSTLVTFFQDALAISQVQNLWNQSLIVQQFKAKIIVRARYGYQETDTGYTVYLGGCFEPGHSWGKPETRQKYLDDRALHLTIFNSLDIKILREYLDVNDDLISDEKLLVLMHESRVESKFIATNDQKASQIWLVEQKHKETKPSTRKKL